MSPALCSFLQDDLLSLKVVSVLHHLSIKRAIQVLRINNFEPNCLRRRPSDEVVFALRVTQHAPSTHMTVLCAVLKPFSSWKRREGCWVPQSLTSSLIYVSGFVFLYSFPSSQGGSTWVMEAKGCVLVSLPPFLVCISFSSLLKPEA